MKILPLILLGAGAYYLFSGKEKKSEKSESTSETGIFSNGSEWRIKSISGNYFVEVNQNGQWYMIHTTMGNISFPSKDSALELIKKIDSQDIEIGKEGLIAG